jgi:hypothetical protein
VTALFGIVVVVIVVSVTGAIWRTRHQFANPRTEARWVFLILVVAGAGLMSTGPNLGRYVIAAIPVALVAGWLLGRALEGTLSFWSDPATGRTMFRGGAAYFVILAVSALSRIFLRYVFTGSLVSHTDPVGLIAQALMVTAGALIFMDAGLYFARAQAIAAAAGERMSWRWFSLATSRA